MICITQLRLKEFFKRYMWYENNKSIVSKYYYFICQVSCDGAIYNE